MSHGRTKNIPREEPRAEGVPATSLTRVLEQSEQVKELVEDSAKDLALVNTALKVEIAHREAQPGVEDALKKSEAVEAKVEDAADKLTVVNLELEDEVRERVLLDHQFAAVKEQEEAARYSSFHDVLTGLPNRALFNDRLSQAITQARRHRRTMAVLYLDLDKFKVVNDTHGHDVGDSVLKMVAQRLRESTRGDDTVSRLGGDEFLFLLSEIGAPRDIALVAEKVIEAIQAPFEVRVNDANVKLSIGTSVGIAIFPKDGDTVDTLVISADLAMYRAKQEKSRYAFAS